MNKAYVYMIDEKCSFTQDSKLPYAAIFIVYYYDVRIGQCYSSMPLITVVILIVERLMMSYLLIYEI